MIPAEPLRALAFILRCSAAAVAALHQLAEVVVGAVMRRRELR